MKDEEKLPLLKSIVCNMETIADQNTAVLFTVAIVAKAIYQKSIIIFNKKD